MAFMNKIRVVCNTSPIIALLYLDKLNLLWEIFDEVILPEAVYKEICVNSKKYASQIQQVEKAIENKFITLYKVKNSKMVNELYGKLHHGELEVIFAAKELGIKLTVIDEIAARKMAREFLIDTIGIIGILLLAKKDNLLLMIKPFLDDLISNGYRISKKLYIETLKRANEE